MRGLYDSWRYELKKINKMVAIHNEFVWNRVGFSDFFSCFF